MEAKCRQLSLSVLATPKPSSKWNRGYIEATSSLSPSTPGHTVLPPCMPGALESKTVLRGGSGDLRGLGAMCHVLELLM